VDIVASEWQIVVSLALRRGLSVKLNYENDEKFSEFALVFMNEIEPRIWSEELKVGGNYVKKVNFFTGSPSVDLY
jgi:hypothetical protein